MKNKKYIFGNWKMNPLKKEDALQLAVDVDNGLDNSISSVHVGIAPPSLFLSEIKNNVSNIFVGAQNVFWKKDTGAFTGEVSPDQLKDIGADFTLVGHSERRKYVHESDEDISKKIKASLESDLKVILCVGESYKIREKGSGESKDFVKNQIKEALSLIDSSSVNQEKIIIAYEPLWSISTFENSKPATPETAEEMISFIKDFVSDKYSLQIPVLYGGSTDSNNIYSFIKENSIDGVLVGSSSLNSDEFLKMVNVFKKLN